MGKKVEIVKKYVDFRADSYILLNWWTDIMSVSNLQTLLQILIQVRTPTVLSTFLSYSLLCLSLLNSSNRIENFFAMQRKIKRKNEK